MAAFTLLELLITLTILMILLLLAIPSFESVQETFYADAAITQLYRAIQLARSEAIKTNSIVTLCPSEAGYQCQQDWSKGYVVFIDHAATGKIEADNSVIHFFKPIKGEGTLTWKNFRVKNYLQMTALGTTNAQNGSFLYCSKTKRTCRSLMISITGRIRIAK